MSRSASHAAPGSIAVPGASTLCAVAGPLLIVATVTVVLHDYLLGGLASRSSSDVLSFSLPMHCFAGTSLADGTIPAWNPYSFGGAPFAADPQSGWMYLPVMLLYSTLPCDTALGIFVWLNPALAGLGIFWFLRSERLSRSAATTGGVVLSLAIAGSLTVQKLPFAGTLAWTALLLAAASRMLRARTWTARLLWAALTAVCWGQVAAAFLTHGLILATGALVAFLGVRIPQEVRAGRLGASEAVVVVSLVLVALPAVNLAYFVPRLAYLPRTILGGGYDSLARFTADATEGEPGRKLSLAYEPDWPLRLATSPGCYLGAAALCLSFAGLWDRRLRPLTIGFLVYGGVSYIAATEAAGRLVNDNLQSVPLADIYIHAPFRFVYGVLLAIAVLASLGVEAWRAAGFPRLRLVMLAPGLALWGIAPLVAGAHPQGLLLFAVGALAGGALLVLGLRRPLLLAFVPVLLAVELGIGALNGQSHASPLADTGLEGDRVWRLDPLNPLPQPSVDVGDYLHGEPLRQAARDARGRVMNTRLRLSRISRPLLMRYEGLEGYNSMQLTRYFAFVRSTAPPGPSYHVSGFSRPVRVALETFAVGSVLGAKPLHPYDVDRLRSGVRVFRLRRPSPRVSLVTSWDVVDDASAALDAVSSSTWDPGATAVLEDDPGIEPSAAPRRTGTASGTASYDSRGPQAARVTVDSPRPALLVVRNVFDPNWHATIDGRPAEVLPADYVTQAVAVPRGRHTVRLTYDDPSIGYGLAGSAAAVAVYVTGALALRRRRNPPVPAARDEPRALHPRD
ncbi:MAG: hypothetical protein ABR529_14815 [Actinomycetota bacterium]